MSNLVPITELDVIFISYDEPNADENYANLLDKCSWAKRSHGVYGSDAAHKAAAKLSDTDRFITVDADNIVYDDFFNIELDMTNIKDNDVLSYVGNNIINGLAYGNGGVKCWPVKVVDSMRTHEAAPASDKRAQVDFCWNINYIQMNKISCDVMNNGSPLQAWRAGFREGVKMGLNDGDVIDPNEIKNIYSENYNRLLIWMSVGEDVDNGLWAIYGARLGCYMTNIVRKDWDWKNVRDFEWLNSYFNNEVLSKFTGGSMICPNTGINWDQDKLRNESKRIGEELRGVLNIEISDLDNTASKFFKTVYHPVFV